jgi:histidine triad (HIT) family protein
MASVFTRILAGEIPGRFVWKDEHCFVITTINPIKPGHALVIPRREIDHWLDVPPELSRHLFDVAQTIGRAQMQVFHPKKVGLSIVGLEVRHVHLHVIPIDGAEDMDFARAEKSPDPKALDAAATRLRAALKGMGFPQSAA